jgi:NTP pyrophosphatase (non-canonical NTP hydrolase)
MQVINQQFTEANKKRACEAFDTQDNDNLYWVTALAEEVGEVAGKVKKMKRGFTKRDEKKITKDYEAFKENNPETEVTMEQYFLAKLKSKLADEMADVFIYLDLMASHNDIDLSQAVTSKFNEVSKAMDYDGTI